MKLTSDDPPDAHTTRLPDPELPPVNWRLWIWIGVGTAALTIVTVLGPFMFCRDCGCRGRDLIEASSNLRQAGFALLEFETTYGSYPNNDTISKVQNDHPQNTIPLGKISSNDYFRQLFASKICDSEYMFHSNPQKKPDGVFDGARALEKGECAFSYVCNVTSNSKPETPQMLYPLVKGQRIFDYKICKELDGKAVILFSDCSVKTFPVDKSGRVFINGKDLFDPSQPFWNGKVPDVRWPE
jgi:hypothetical protein